MKLTIAKIFQQKEKISAQKKKVLLSGWVRSVREQKTICFITINDGSTTRNLQLVIDNHSCCWEKVKQINFASGITVQGEVVITPNREEALELQQVKILSINKTEEDYPLQKQEIPLSVLWNYPHLRVKTNFFLNMFRLRSSVCSAVHDFLRREGFYNVTPPVLTNNDAEGAGETFSVSGVVETGSFFNTPNNLAVSAQLHLEALSQGLGKVYSLNPCFRADKSHTYRHLAEFWMLEIEVREEKQEKIIALAERFVKFVLKFVLKKNLLEIMFFEKHTKRKLIDCLKKLIKIPFLKMEYCRTVSFLKKKFKDLEFGSELKSEHEKYLCNYFSCPVFVFNYPKKIKAFYMKENLKNKEVVDSFDLLVPEIGELIGGGMRATDCFVLQNRMNEKQQKDLQWYLSLRKFGYLPTGGFGVGLERLLMMISGTDNIRDVIPFPRFFGSLIC